MSTRAKWQNLQIFKIQAGGRPPFWKSLNRHMSVKNRPILMKFGTLANAVVTWQKLKFLKMIDGGGRHLENRLFGHNSSTDCLISAKFCMRKQRATWQKLQLFLKIQDDGRPPFWKWRPCLNRHISVKNRPILMKFGTRTLHQISNPMRFWKALSQYLRCNKVMTNEQKTANINGKNLKTVLKGV